MLGIEDNFVNIADMSVGASLGEEGRLFPGGSSYTDLTPNRYQQNAPFTSGSTNGYSSAPCGLPQNPDLYQHHQQHPSQHQHHVHPHQQDTQQYLQHHNGHSSPAQQEQHYSQHHNDHSHSPSGQHEQQQQQQQQQQQYPQHHNGHSHSPPAQQQQYPQHHNGHSHSPPTQQQQQHPQHQKQQEQQYAHHQQQHLQPPQHLPHHGDSPNGHDFCPDESTELPPPLSPPPTKERFSYTRYQLEVLAGIYEAVRYPNAAQKRLIAKRVGITRDQVKIWFQNRRRKDVVGVPAGGKTKAPDVEGEKRTSMVPEHILSGVVNELLRYSDDAKGQGKKGKTIKDTPRPAPYNRPEPDCPRRVPAGVGSTTLHALPTTSAVARLGNSTAAATGTHFTSAAGPHNTSATDSHFTSATGLPISGGPYTTNGHGILNGSVPPMAAHPVSTVGPSHSPSQQTSPLSPHSNHTSPKPPLVVNGGTNHASPHSDVGLQHNNSSIHDVHDVDSVHNDHDVSGISEVSSVNYDTDDVRSRLQRTPPAVRSSRVVGVSPVVAPPGIMSIPSSEQLDMVAPPNAIVPGAPTLPDGDMSGAESSSSSDDEEPEPEKKHSIVRKSQPVHVEVPPNVTLSASDPLPDMKALHSRYPTHQGFFSQHHMLGQQRHAGGIHQGWRPGGGSGLAIHAPIPSYPAGIHHPHHQPSWLTDHHHHHPGAPLEPYLPAHKAAAEFGLPGHHHQQSYLGALPPGGPLGHQLPPGAALPTSSATSGLHHPAYSHGPELASLGGRDRVLPFPLVAEPPLRLSSMAGPPPYSSPYNPSYKASPHGLRSLYPDHYQPMLISSFSNPYFGLDPAAWQPSTDRGNYPNLG